MEIDDNPISRRLEQIVARHRLAPVPFVPTPWVSEIDEDLTSFDEIEGLFHSSGLLIRDGQPVLAYIRDHTFLNYPDIERCRRVHFAVCAALKSMKRQGRFERYRITNRESNRYLIDVGTAWGPSNEMEVALYPCQYCLGEISYQNFDYNMSGPEKRYIVKNFDVRELFVLLRRRLTRHSERNISLRLATKNAKPATAPSDYPRRWPQFSENYRRRRNHTCERCHVQLDDRPDLLDVHHINGDKADVRLSNLRCLCKLCHSEEHPHYKVTDADRLFIENRRKGQRRR